MHLVEQHHTQNGADAGAGLEAVQGLGVVLFRRLHDGQCDRAESLVLEVNQGESDFHTLGHGGSGKPLSDSAAVGFVGDRLAHLRPVVRTVGMLDVGQSLCALARQMQTAPEQLTSRPHVRGRDRGLGQHPAAQPHGHFLGIDRVVFGLATMAGLHGERMSQDKRQAFASAEVGEPVPREDTFDTDDPVLSVGRDGLEQWFWPGGHSAVHQNRTILVQEAEGHGAGMPIDATGTWVLLRIASPEVASASLVFSLLPAYHGGMWRGGLNKYQRRASDGCQRPLVPRFRCQPRLTPSVRFLSHVNVVCVKTGASPKQHKGLYGRVYTDATHLP